MCRKTDTIRAVGTERPIFLFLLQKIVQIANQNAVKIKGFQKFTGILRKILTLAEMRDIIKYSSAC